MEWTFIRVKQETKDKLMKMKVDYDISINDLINLFIDKEERILSKYQK